MWVERNTIRVLHFLHTLFLILCTFNDSVYSQGDPCNQCVDVYGNSCSDRMLRFSSSRFWILKGDQTATFNEAVQKCQSFGFVMAEINSEADQALFEKLATTNGDMYWVGFLKQRDEWTKLDNVTSLTWISPTLDETDDQLYPVGEKAIALDSAGAWYTAHLYDTSRVICQFPPTSPCYKGIGQKPETPKPKVTQNSDCPEPEFENNQMVRTGPGSKYLYPKSLYFTSSTEATTLCNKLDLEPATVNGKWEYKHLVQFVFEKKLNKTRRNFKVNLGAVNTGGGIYEYINQPPPFNQLKFQAFNLQEREYFYDDADCLAIEWTGNYHCFIPVPCTQKSEVMPLCEYRGDAACSVDTPLALQDEDLQLNKLFKIGETQKYNYFGAMKQKTWEEALKVCTSNQLKLLRIHKGQPEESKEILKIANDYRTSIGVSSWSGYSWIYDKFEAENDLMNELNAKTGWKLNDRTVNKELETCNVLTLDAIRPVLCELPNYFICYSARMQITTTTTAAPASNDSPETPVLAARADTRAENNVTEECFAGLKMTISSFPSDGLSKGDMVELIKTGVALKFSATLVHPKLAIKAGSRWRIPHVKGMGTLTKAICPEQYVMPEFIHLISNFIMIYYNSMAEQKLPEDRVAFWTKMEKKYDQCQNTSLKFKASAGLITEFEVQGGKINIVNETADAFPVLDYMLEGLWYMFELTAVSCYKSPETKILWLSNYFTHFRKDFTDVFKKWWANPGETNYGVLFGDMDLYQNLYNLRACAVACFQNYNVEDLLFIRPVEMDDDTFMTKTFNKRT